MPATSQAQYRFMEAVAHGGIKKKGLSPEKASEYVHGQQYGSLPHKAGVGAIVDDLFKKVKTQVEEPPPEGISNVAKRFRTGDFYNGQPRDAERDGAIAARDAVVGAVKNGAGEAAHLAGSAKKLIGLKDGGTVATVEPTKKGQKPIKFKEGGEHASLGVPKGQKIPASKAAAARNGSEGSKAQKQELFRENVLKGAKNGFPSPTANQKRGGVKTPTGKSSYSLIKSGYGHGVGM